MTKKKMPRMKDVKPFGFLSRAQILEAKAHRLNRELEAWADAGANLTDTKAQASQRMLIDEIIHLEPQPTFKEITDTEGMVIPPVVSFLYDGVWRVAIGQSPRIAGKIGTQDAFSQLWYVAPSLEGAVDPCHTWSELLTQINAEGLGSLEVIK